MTPHQSSIGGLPLKVPFMLGAGAKKSPSEALRWLTTCPVVPGSYSLQPSSGNNGSKLTYPNTLDETLANGEFFNWFGLPNIGIDSMMQAFKDRQGTHSIIPSLVAFEPDDFLSGIRIVGRSSVADALELNFGCRNTNHIPLSYNSAGLQQLLEGLPETTIPVWLKFSPFQGETASLLPEIAKLVNRYKDKVAAVVTCNSDWGYAGVENISSPDGYASRSGPVIKELAIEQLLRFKELLDPSIDIISVGGITTGADIVERLELGAAAVQLTTVPFFMKSPDKFLPYLLADGTLEPYLIEKGYW